MHVRSVVHRKFSQQRFGPISSPGTSTTGARRYLSRESMTHAAVFCTDTTDNHRHSASYLPLYPLHAVRLSLHRSKTSVGSLISARARTPALQSRDLSPRDNQLLYELDAAKLRGSPTLLDLDEIPLPNTPARWSKHAQVPALKPLRERWRQTFTLECSGVPWGSPECVDAHCLLLYVAIPDIAHPASRNEIYCHTESVGPWLDLVFWG